MTLLVMNSPVGKLAVETGPSGRLLRIDFADDGAVVSPSAELAGSEAVTQLEAFFTGARRRGDLDSEFDGTAFQKEVWQQIAVIPYGETVTYGDIANAIGKHGASRAVGAACGRNPISVVVPCHRVVGAGNRLTGFGGGLDRKAWLLDFERRQLATGSL